MELKSKFMDISRMALMEFVVNHPGHTFAAEALEYFYSISEEQLQRALEEHESLADAVLALIRYKFTAGRGKFKEPSWLKDS